MKIIKKKVCSKCKEAKELEQFSPRKDRKSGKNSWCKSCIRKAGRDLYQVSEGREHWANNLKQLYDLSVSEFEDLREQQQGVCAICGNIERGGRELSVDHDHITLEVRGLLCLRCNMALGCVGDNPALLRKAADYLESKR